MIKNRAPNSPNNNSIGKDREDLYKNAFLRITKSTRNGYYLESITLIESIMSDRLESRLQYRQRSSSFETLGKLIKLFSTETDTDLRNLVRNDINSWREKRNRALHEMVKIEEGVNISWADRMILNESIAKDGLELVRNLDKQVTKLKKLGL